jgi:hypothetical protein
VVFVSISFFGVGLFALAAWAANCARAAANALMCARPLSRLLLLPNVLFPNGETDSFFFTA